MASSPTTERPAGSSAEILLIVSALMIGGVVVAGTFAPEILPWADATVNHIADELGIDF